MDTLFTYRGCTFTLSVLEARVGQHQSYVLYRHGLPGREHLALPEDSEPYASAHEALRHAQQQAVRWVQDRTGDGRGRF
jgi:hypothetical protein